MEKKTSHTSSSFKSSGYRSIVSDTTRKCFIYVTETARRF